MVEASGLGLDDEPSEALERPLNRWKVLHSRVIVRSQPSIKAKIIGFKRQGDVVTADWSLASLWIKLHDQPGWMLTHGSQLNLPQLLAPCDDE